jgi:cell division transport system permease protein
MSRKKNPRGAQESRRSRSDIWRAWRYHHKSSALESLGRLADSPLQTLMTTLVIAIAMVLPATLLLLLNNVQHVSAKWDSNPKITVFLHLQTQPELIDQLQTKIRKMPEIEQVTYITPEQALMEFQSSAGFQEALAGLEQNPLPPTLVLNPTNASVNPHTLERLAQQISQDPSVDQVKLDLAWVQRLYAIMVVAQQFVLGIAGLLGLGVLLVIGNTVRLEIENRRDEILVAKLVGATDGFVRRPFLYTGAWYGIVGGLLACLLVSTGVAGLSQGVRDLAASYQSEYLLQGLGVAGLLLMTLSGLILGLLGAWLVVGRHLKAIEPH